MTKELNIFAEIPSIDFLLGTPACAALLEIYSRSFIKSILQEEIQSVREKLKYDAGALKTSRNELIQWIIDGARQNLNQRMTLSLRYTINATGIILHTNLGRARLSEAARQNLQNVTSGYCNLEIELQSGKRGQRNALIENLVCELTRAEAACVVNNNAAAVLISLNSLSSGKEAIISRGQLIEIGGAFRMPDVMEKSGVRMVEVGTTNKTRIQDYENAITDQTAVLVIAHTSNYRVMGFTEETAIAEVAALGHKYHLPVLHDLGGGILVDLRNYGLPYEPLVQDSLACGVDVVTFSGDKVLGGPQSGFIVGKKKYIDQINRNPLMRALRCGKLIYAALEPTLQLFLHERELLKRHPTLKMLTEPLPVVRQRAEYIVTHLPANTSFEIAIEESIGQTGSGALPLEQIPSWAVTVKSDRISAETIAACLRQNIPPIISYIKNDQVFLDMRTVDDNELVEIITALRRIYGIQEDRNG